MADIFISYAKEDREVAAQLAALLESAGWHVWWDRRIPAGRTWRSVLEEALREMRCMIVLWSQESVNSPWVAEEAEEARKLGKTLVPVLIQQVDPPMGFRAIQAADLANWDGAIDDPAAQTFIADLRALLNTPLDNDKQDRVVKKDKVQRGSSLFQWFGAHWLQGMVAGAAIFALLAGWQKWRNSKPPEPAAAPMQESLKVAPAPRLIALKVGAERKEIKPTEALKATAIANYSDGAEKKITDGLLWASSNTSVATIDDGGEIRALRPGTTNITAKVGDVVSSAWALRVKAVEPAPAAAKLVALDVASTRKELFTNEKVSIRTKGRYSDNSEKSLSAGIDWEVSDRTVAAVSPGGELEGLRPGKVQVAARSGSLRSAPLTFTIKEPPRPVPKPQSDQVKAAEPKPVAPPPAPDRSKAQIAELINRAKTYREQGNYGAAMAELEKATAVDALNADVRKEIEQTEKACNAEKVLGNKPNC